jgi:acyl-CoA synthetase (NDP forming)
MDKINTPETPAKAGKTLSMSQRTTSTMSRNVYRRAELLRLFEPRSIAIVGMSSRAGSYGERSFDNLVRVGGYVGRIHFVNARSDRIGDAPCFPDLKSLPEVPDCIIVAVPREAAEGVMEEAAALGVGGAVLYASGYAEVGLAERIAQQERLTAIARGSSLRIVGPNCLGFHNHWAGIAATFTGVSIARDIPPHAIGIVSQSGALGFAFNQAVERGVSIGALFTAGNSCDVDIADEIAFLAEDPRCKAIACLFEGLPDPERLRQAVQLAWDNDKPVVVCKVGLTPEGIAASRVHTATPAGEPAQWQALFEETGLIAVDDAEALIETASFFAKAPAPTRSGVAVAATSGGASIMCADKAVRHGVPLTQPNEATLAVLREHVPDFGSTRNPCDVTGQVTGNPASLTAVCNALMSDPAYGALVMPYPQVNAASGQRNLLLSDIAAAHGKMGCNIWLSEWHESPDAIEAERLPRVAVFRSTERCFATLAAWHRRAARRQR